MTNSHLSAIQITALLFYLNFLYALLDYFILALKVDSAEK